MAASKKAPTVMNAKKAEANSKVHPKIVCKISQRDVKASLIKVVENEDNSDIVSNEFMLMIVNIRHKNKDPNITKRRLIILPHHKVLIMLRSYHTDSKMSSKKFCFSIVTGPSLSVALTGSPLTNIRTFW